MKGPNINTKIGTFSCFFVFCALYQENLYYRPRNTELGSRDFYLLAAGQPFMVYPKLTTLISPNTDQSDWAK